MLDRIDETAATEAKSLLRRSVRQTILDHVWITTSGFFTMAPFMAALMTFGADRIMFSVDYPFSFQCAGAGVLRCVARVSGRSSENRVRERGPANAAAGLTANNGAK